MVTNVFFLTIDRVVNRVTSADSISKENVVTANDAGTRSRSSIDTSFADNFLSFQIRSHSTETSDVHHTASSSFCSSSSLVLPSDSTHARILNAQSTRQHYTTARQRRRYDCDQTVFCHASLSLSAAPMSYASACRGNNDYTDSSTFVQQSPATFLLQSLCPYAEKEGVCEALETGRYCPYIHGDLCDLCEMPALHPADEKQRERHRLVRTGHA